LRCSVLFGPNGGGGSKISVINLPTASSIPRKKGKKDQKNPRKQL
jgi:hypothetical protein